MNSVLFRSGRVCLCQWSEPVSANMVASLLALLKLAVNGQRDLAVVIMHLRLTSARSLLKHSSAFLHVLPAFWAFCQELIVVCQAETGIPMQLQTVLSGADYPHPAMPVRKVSIFEFLDDAFVHAQGLSPRDVIGLRMQGIRVGTWDETRAVG